MNRAPLLVAGLVGCLLSLATLPAAPAEVSPRRKFMVYVGTYTNDKKSEGIYRMELDPATGKLSAPKLAGKAVDPSFLAIHPSGKFLYAVGESDNIPGKGKKPGGAVNAFAIDARTGDLRCSISILRGRRAVSPRPRQGGQVTPSWPTTAAAAPAPCPSARTANWGRRPASSGTRAKKRALAHSINLDASNRFRRRPPTPGSTRCSSTASRTASSRRRTALRPNRGRRRPAALRLPPQSGRGTPCRARRRRRRRSGLLASRLIECASARFLPLCRTTPVAAPVCRPCGWAGRRRCAAVVGHEGVLARLVEDEVTRPGALGGLLIEQRQVARPGIDGEGVDGPAGLLALAGDVVALADGVEELAAGVGWPGRTDRRPCRPVSARTTYAVAGSSSIR